MPKKQIENDEKVDWNELPDYLALMLKKEIEDIRRRLENRYTPREEKLELRRLLARNLSTLQRLLE